MITCFGKRPLPPGDVVEAETRGSFPPILASVGWEDWREGDTVLVLKSRPGPLRCSSDKCQVVVLVEEVKAEDILNNVSS